jgi:hypothetical protein
MTDNKKLIKDLLYNPKYVLRSRLEGSLKVYLRPRTDGEAEERTALFKEQLHKTSTDIYHVNAHLGRDHYEWNSAEEKFGRYIMVDGGRKKVHFFLPCQDLIREQIWSSVSDGNIELWAHPRSEFIKQYRPLCLFKATKDDR